MYRSNDLLALAEGQPCLLGISSRCLGSEGSTTVAAHSNSYQHGKGKAIKAEDVYTVWACYYCHEVLDSGKKLGRKEKEEAFDQAHLKQIEEWTKIATNPTIRPWKKKVAEDAIRYLAKKHLVEN
jgi:hypothetical protein